MKKVIYLVGGIIIACWLLGKCGGNSETESGSYFVYEDSYESFVGTYVVDLTLMQSGKTTTIVLNADGSGYFQEGDSYESRTWWPADNKGGIRFSGGGSDEQACYYMNKSKTKMYWGLNDYMNDVNGYKVKRIK